MLTMLKRLFGEQAGGGSKEVAKERLRLVLLHDRANVSPQYMGLLREDMMKVVSNYMDINPQDMEMNLNRDDQVLTLVANIPVNAVKRPPACPAAAAAEDAPPDEPCLTTGEGASEHAEPTTAAKS